LRFGNQIIISEAGRLYRTLMALAVAVVAVVIAAVGA
jgi:hypothetical protein